MAIYMAKKIYNDLHHQWRPKACRVSAANVFASWCMLLLCVLIKFRPPVITNLRVV